MFKILFVAALVTGLSILVVGCSAEAEPEKPTVASGTWTGKTGDAIFEADITPETITIHVVNGDTKALYWQGTFGADELSEGDYLTSIADTDALESSIMGSSAESKEFKYNEGALNFDFEIMGTTTTVKLNK